MEFSQPPPDMPHSGNINFSVPPPSMTASMPPPMRPPHPGGYHNNNNHHHHGGGPGGAGRPGQPFFRPFVNFARGPGGAPMTQDDFDGKRLRKSVMRKTVDYNSAIIRAIEVLLL